MTPPKVLPDWDVIVVGGGGSGLAAAVAASQGGARTILLEKGAKLGGTTKLAVGSISAPNTRLQRRRGIKDDQQAFIEDSRAFTGPLEERDDLATRQLLAREASETVRFLEALGVAFVGPFPEPPHRVPRMLNVIPGSRAYIAVLARKARASGATIVTSTRVDSLVLEGGKVVGVTLTGPQGTQTLRAGAVVLAAGDYSASPELRAKYINKNAKDVGAANPLSTGDGHRMGAAVGGTLMNMDITDGPQLRFAPPASATFLDRLPTYRVLSKMIAAVANRMPPWVLRRFAKQLLTAWMAPSPEFLTGGPILVDVEGRKIEAGKDGLAYAVVARPTQSAYLILSEQVAKDVADVYISTAPGIAYAYWRDYVRGRRDLVASGSSVKELGQRLGMNAQHLVESVGSHSGDAGRWYALGPVRALFTTTEGGLHVDDECRVLTADERPIDGLWAAGSTGQSGLVLSGHGVHILWAISSGRLAGASAARYAPA